MCWNLCVQCVHVIQHKMSSSAIAICILLHFATQQTNAECPVGCDCSSDVMKCSRQDIPRGIPANIRKLYVSDINVTGLTPNTFVDLIWRNLTFLDISFGNSGIIRSRSFVGLSGLRHLGIHGNFIWHLEPMVFQGLDILRTLDLSGCGYLSTDDLLRALDAARSSVLNYVNNLTLVGLQSRHVDPIDMDDRFFRSISLERRLTYLDISYTNIRTIDFNSLLLICNSLEHLKVRNVSVASLRSYLNAPVCKSLRTLDMSGIYLPQTNYLGITFEYLGFHCKFSTFDNVECLSMNGVVETPVNINSYHLNMTECAFHMKKIEMRQNRLQKLNFTVTLHQYLVESVSDIDLSDNILEYISPETINPSKNLEVLRLSKNKLYKMQNENSYDFERLLYKFQNLKQFLIAQNQLTYISKSFFQNNRKLEHIDVSWNKLKYVMFDFKHLTKLKYLDLGRNMITEMDEKVLQMFANRNHDTTKNSSTTNSSDDVSSRKFQVNLASNPFVCSCRESTFAFLNWFKTSASFDRKDPYYYCSFQEDSLNMITLSVEELKKSCERFKLISNLKIIVPLVVALLILVVILIVFLRRRWLKIKRNKDFINQLNNMEKPFLIFLSFCSDDTEFVEIHVRIPLQEALQRITKNNRNFICVGDREFRLGLTVQAEVMRCTEESSVVLFVLSKTFCKKAWCRMEVSEAYEQRKPIIMLMKERVDQKYMSAIMRKIFNRYTHASWVDDEGGGHLEPDIHSVAKSVIALARKDCDTETQL